MKSNQKLDSIHPNRHVLFIGLTLVVVLVAILAALGLWQLHAMTEARLKSTAQNMAASLDKSMEGMVATIDVALQASADTLTDLIMHGTLNPKTAAVQLSRDQKRLPMADWVHATNARGDIMYGADIAVPPVNIGDRAYFQTLRDQPSFGLYVSKAFQSRRRGHDIWLFARRFHDAQGNFAGIVFASLSISTLEQMLSQLAMEPGGVATIRDVDMGMIARRTFGSDNPINYGDRKLSQPFVQALKTNPREGVFVSGGTSIDGVNRTQAYRGNARYDFMVVVGIGEEFAYAEWRRQAWMVAGLVALLGCMSVVFWRITLRAWNQIEADVKEIQQSNARFRAVIEGSPVPISLNNENREITYVNQAFTRTFGYVQSDIPTLQQWWEKAYPDVQYREHIALTWQNHLVDSEQHGYPFEPVEARIRCKDGAERIALVSAAPLSATFKDTHVVVLNDMTEHMLAEAALRELNATLDQRVTQRTLELADALQHAELASRSRGAFLANMSHEIRTPMNSVLGMAFLALKADPPPRLRGYLEKIQVAGKHLMGIISDILDFSKIDAGKLDLEISHFEPRRMMADVIQLCESRARDKGLEIEWSVAPEVPTHLLGDPLRLGQILINYLNNAIKFTSTGGISLHTSLEPTDHPASPAGDTKPAQCTVRWRVTDSGIGMSKDQVGRMFQSFEQADNTTTRRYGGTGLGLAICKQLAHCMGGKVGVHSVPGQGSSFWFTAVLQIPDEIPPMQELLAGDVQSEKDLDGTHILVVDDNSFNLEVAQGILETAGIQVTTAHDAASAFAELDRGPFDCVLMDIQMPDMDGLEATRHIRADSKLAHTAVVGLTANATRAHQKLCKEAGMQAVVTKPIDPQKLFATLARVLQTARNRSLNTLEPAPDTSPMPLEMDGNEVDALAELATVHVVWNPQALVDCVGHHPVIHARLIEHFLDNARKTLATLQAALHQQHSERLTLCAHNLKSSAHTVGAMELAVACARLENAGQAGDLPTCLQLSAEVLRCFERVEIAMQSADTIQVQ